MADVTVQTTTNNDDEHMLSTLDNPVNPFLDFDAWQLYDELLGHHTTSLLARIVKLSDEMTESDENYAIEQAIVEIVREDVTGLYVRVARKR